MLRLAAKSRSIFRKAITCRSLSSSSTCSPSPWLMLPPSAEGESGRTYNFYSLAKEKEVSFNCNNRMTKMRSKSYPDMDESELVGSSHGWIALFNPRNTDMFLFNPLTGTHIKLPPMDTIYTPPNAHTRACVHKIIITCPPDSGGGLCRAVMLYNKKRLAYCTPGSSIRWTGPIDPHFEPDRWYWRRYQDFVYDPKRDLLLCMGHGLEGWDITNSSKDAPRLVFENRHLLEEYWFGSRRDEQVTKQGYYIKQYKHLVVHGGQIFLVFRDFVHMIPPHSGDDEDYYDADYPCKTLGFRVHRIDSDGVFGEREADSLGGLAMFVGRNHAFALRADDHPGIEPNSIYFTQHWSTVDISANGGGHDVGVFDYESKTISPCYYSCDEHSFNPMWFTPTPEPTGI